MAANIPTLELTPEQAALHPQEGGAQATQRAARVTQETARSIGTMYAQEGEQLGRFVSKAGERFTDYMATRDITAGAKAHTELQAKAASELPDIVAKASDPVQAVKDYYRDVYTPAAEKIQGSMITKQSQRWAADHMETGASAMLTHGISVANEVIATRAINDFNATTHNLTVLAQTNPEQVGDYIKQAGQTLDHVKGTLPGVAGERLEGHRLKVQSEIANAAGQALAEKNPVQFQKDLEGGWGKEWLTPNERKALEHYSHYVEHQNKMKGATNSRISVADWAAQHQNPDGSVKPVTPQSVGQIAGNPAIQPQDKDEATKFAISLNQNQQKHAQYSARGRGAPPARNYAIEWDLERRIGDKDHPTTLGEIQQYVDMNTKDPRMGITAERAMALAEKVMRPKKAAKAAHFHSDPTITALNDQAYHLMVGNGDSSNGVYRIKHDQFKVDTIHELEAAVEQNPNVPVKDAIKHLTDPNSPDYLWRQERVNQYKPTPKELREHVTAPDSVVRIRKPPVAPQGPAPGPAPGPGPSKENLPGNTRKSMEDILRESFPKPKAGGK